MAAGDGEVESQEQQQALALARARMRSKQQAAPPEEGGGVMRQVGLTARAAGPQAAGAVAGGAMGSVLPGVGTVAGAGAGALAMSVIQLADRLGGTNYLDQIMDKIGLPKPATDEEKLAGAGAEAMAGMGAMSAAARGFAPAVREFAGPAGSTGARGPRVAEVLADAPGLGAASAASGGVAQEAVRQNPPGIIPPELGGNQTEQFLANVAGSALAPAGVAAGQAVGRAVGGFAGDIRHAVGASFGNSESIKRLTGDVIRNITKEDASAVRDALRQGTTHVEGAGPTVGEAIAEANMKIPGRQVGGEIVKLQEQISGAPGVANVLPSKMKANREALATHIENVKTATAPMREAALSGPRVSHLLGRGVPVEKIQHDILMESLAPGFRANTVLRASANDVSAQIKRQLTQKGHINPDDLYAIRMNIGNTIRRHLEKSGGRWDNKIAGGFEKNLQRSIDDAIESSGAVGWKSYLKTYSEGMAKVTAHEDRLKAMKAIGQEVQGVHPETQVRDLLPKIPTLLHRPTMMVNFVLKMIAQDASKPVIKELAARMQDPQEFLALMSRPDAAPAKQATNQIMMHAAILTNLIQKHQAEQPQEPAQ